MCLIYPMFFFSGAAALIYKMTWVRFLTPILGGSHLAVTAVLSIFVAGLAIGGTAIGMSVDREQNSYIETAQGSCTANCM